MTAASRSQAPWERPTLTDMPALDEDATPTVDNIPLIDDTLSFPSVRGHRKPQIRTVRGEPRNITHRGVYQFWLPWHLLRKPLLAVLVVQTLLSLRLIWTNTAFTDEALYLWAGRTEWQHWLHGVPLPPGFPTYFSGAPVVYPPLGAAADAAFGLAGARLLSLVFMLTASVLLYKTTDRLFGGRSGLLAAAVFASVGSAQFLGAFATYDAMALTLLALASWLAVKAAARPPVAQTAFLVAAGCALAAADAAKYASALWNPVVIALAALTAWRLRGFRRGLASGLTLTGILVAVVTLLIRLGGSGYWHGILFTTVSRQASTASARGIGIVTAGWIGIALFLAVIGLAVILSTHRELPVRLTAVTLLAAGLLAPANQARIHVFTSLFKHVGFGAWFTAALAGVALSSLPSAVPAVKRAAAFKTALAAAAVAAVIGTALAANQFSIWKNETVEVTAARSALSAYPGPALVLDDLNVVRYYVPDLDYRSSYGRLYFAYQDTNLHKRFIGTPAFADAIKHQYFSVVIVAFVSRVADSQIVDDIREYGGYRLYSSATGHSRYKIWVRERSDS